MKKYIGIKIYLMLLLLYSCNSKYNKNTLTQKFNVKKLDFAECTIAYDEYQYLVIKLPKGYKIKDERHEGLCEYQFIYKDSSILYVSTDVWFGSRLNISNRYSINHSGYHKKNISDTIRLEGKSSSDKFWAENITGNYTIGYVNASSKKKEEFTTSMQDIKTMK